MSKSNTIFDCKFSHLLDVEGMHLKKISEIDDADPECENCLGLGWVCENHKYTPWLDGDFCHCRGAGMPCSCNPLSVY